MTRYLIGIDNGSQSSKVTIFDEVGTVVSSGRCALRPPHSPSPGVVEHPDDDLWSSIGEAAQEAMRGFAGDPRDIVGIGLCTIRFCRALLLEDGSLAQPVMSWMDDRVAEPHCRDEADGRVAKVTTSSGYLTHRLTGAFRDTSANYKGQWPIDADTWRWLDDGPEFDAFGLRRDQLFDLVDPGEILGRVTEAAAAHTGFPPGVPVVATANDKAVEALGCGLRHSDTLVISLGTYIASMTVGSRNASDATSFWSNFASVPGDYLYESGGIRRGMWTISWFRDLFGPEAVQTAQAVHASHATRRSLEEALGAEAADTPPGSAGLLTILDWLAPTEAPHRRGTIMGFDGRHGRGHLYRSILEGIALTMSERAGALAHELGISFDRVVVSGGGSKSDLMMRITADVFGVTAVRNVVGDAAGLGAAVCAAVATLVHPTFEAATDAMVRERDVFVPDPANHAVYRELAAIHRDVTKHTDPIYRRLAALNL